MKTNMTKYVVLLALLLTASLAMAQDAPSATKTQTTSGFVEFGARGLFGEVYGRPDLPFEPSLRDSKLNEYRDIRDGFFLKKARIDMEDFLGTDNYLSLQAAKAAFRDQSYLASFGKWGSYKLTFRFDQTPHVFSNTARTIYSRSAAHAWSIPNALRTQLQTLAAQTTGCPSGTATGCNLPSTLELMEPQMSRFVPELDRKAGMLGFEWSITPDFGVFASYRRERITGTRPIGIVMNSSPSASLTGGYGVEAPEVIDYNNNDARVGMEFGRDRWGFQATWIGSFFEQNVPFMEVDNPFRTTDCITGGGSPCTSATQGPAFARYSLYPSNRATQFALAGKFNLAKDTTFMASITPGWMRQDQPFIPYTSNSVRLAQTGPLPAANLNGEKQTLAMNYRLASSFFKHFEVKAEYRHYDYNNNTPEIFFTPVHGDIGAPGSPTHNRRPGYNRKNLDLIGSLVFMKDSSIKFGYQGEWMNREHRDVHHSMENGFIAGVDFRPRKWVSFDATYRYAVRDPEDYHDEFFDEITGGMTLAQVNSRRIDQTARVRNSLDMSLTFDPFDRASFSVFAASTQDDYNRPGGVNSSTPLNFISGNYIDYYIYGFLKDLSWTWGADMNFTLTDKASFFTEYAFERAYRSMTSRYRVPGNSIAAGVLVPQNCGQTGAPCDSPNNDWTSEARDIVHTGTLGFDLNPTKRSSFSSYYSLSAGKGIVTTRPLGNTTLTASGAANPNRFMLTGGNAAVDYPDTVTRLHELGAIFRFKLSEMISPKFEYRFQQWDNKDYQTSPMSPFMGCVSPIPNGPPVTNSVPGCTTPLLLTNTAAPVGSPSAFYPYYVVGDTSAARYLFLGVDQPSYRSHYVAATLEFRF